MGMLSPSLTDWGILISEPVMTTVGSLHLKSNPPHVSHLDATLEVLFVTLTDESHYRFMMPTATVRAMLMMSLILMMILLIENVARKLLLSLVSHRLPSQSLRKPFREGNQSHQLSPPRFLRT
jgi:hypothetical protein